MNPISFRKSCISSVVMPAISCFPKAGNTCARKCFLQVSIVERFHLEYPDQEITVLRDGQTVPYDNIVSAF